MAFSADDWADCPHRVFVPAYRSYGANIPDFCQGAVYPGDEAYHKCGLTGEYCEEAPRSKEDCPHFVVEEE